MCCDGGYCPQSDCNVQFSFVCVSSICVCYISLIKDPDLLTIKYSHLQWLPLENREHKL